MQNRVLILLPVYNGSSYIEEQILSIMNQSYKNIALIVRDNCSEDRTVEIVSSLAEQYGNITLLKSSTNIGIIRSISQLIEAAGASPYIMFADGDDVWLKDKIAVTMQRMKNLENRYGLNKPYLVHSDLKVVDKNLNLISPSFMKYTKLNPARYQLQNLLSQNIVTGCTMMMNQPLLSLAKPIPPVVVMHDWWIALVGSAFGIIDYLPVATIFYRQHGNNDTGAIKYGLRAYFHQRKFNTKEQVVAQAKAFLERYEKKLSTKQGEILLSFIKFMHARGLQKVFLMYKHGFQQHGFYRYCKELLL